MENLDLNELIEQYLDGSLPAAMRAEVESRLATDDRFRAAVELHRQMHAELADPRKLQLRDLLQEIVREPLPTPSKYGWLKWPGLALAVLLIFWLGWLWLSPSPERSPEPGNPEETKSIPPSIQPGEAPPDQNEPPKSNKINSNIPIAMANPAAFALNHSFEDRLGSQIRSTDGAADVSNPVNGANFTPKNGFVSIHFKGTFTGDADTARYPLALKIYGNRQTADQPLKLVLPDVILIKDNLWAFSKEQRLRLEPGLYYYTIERQTDDDLVFVGKFTVGAR